MLWQLCRAGFRISFKRERDWSGKLIYSANVGWFWVILLVVLIVKACS